MYKSNEVLRGGEITRAVDDIAFVVEKCCIRGITCKEISTTCAMLNNFQSIMLSFYFTGFVRMLDRQVGDVDKGISIGQIFGSGESIKFAPGYFLANTGMFIL